MIPFDFATLSTLYSGSRRAFEGDPSTDERGMATLRFPAAARKTSASVRVIARKDDFSDWAIDSLEQDRAGDIVLSVERFEPTYPPTTGFT